VDLFPPHRQISFPPGGGTKARTLAPSRVPPPPPPGQSSPDPNGPGSHASSSTPPPPPPPSNRRARVGGPRRAPTSWCSTAPLSVRSRAPLAEPNSLGTPDRTFQAVFLVPTFSPPDRSPEPARPAPTSEEAFPVGQSEAFRAGPPKTKPGHKSTWGSNRTHCGWGENPRRPTPRPGPRPVFFGPGKKNRVNKKRFPG